MFTALKFVVGIALLSALFYFNLIDLSLFKEALASPHLLIIAFLCMLSTVFMAAWRWQILMGALGLSLGFGRTLSFTFIGQFFSIFLPGGYGGDLVRVGLAHRQHPGNLSSLVISSLIDRISGLLGLLVIALVMIAFIPAEFRLWLFTLALGSLAIGAGSLFIMLRYRPFFEKYLSIVPKPVGPLLTMAFQKATSSLILYGERKTSLVAALAISIIQYVIILIALYMLGVAMNLVSLHWISYFIAGITGLIANALPFTPGGLGIGETAFGKMATYLGGGDVEKGYSTVFLALRGMITLTALIGIWPFLTYRNAVKETLSHPQDGTTTPPQMGI